MDQHQLLNTFVYSEVVVVVITIRYLYLHLLQNRYPVQDPLQTRSDRTPLNAGWCTRTPCLPCQPCTLQHLGPHLAASHKYCSSEWDPQTRSPAENKGIQKAVHKNTICCISAHTHTRAPLFQGLPASSDKLHHMQWIPSYFIQDKIRLISSMCWNTYKYILQHLK